MFILILLPVAQARRSDPNRRPEPALAVRCRHQIHAALVPHLVLPAHRRQEECRPARRAAVPDLFPPVGDALATGSLCAQERPAGDLPQGV